MKHAIGSEKTSGVREALARIPRTGEPGLSNDRFTGERPKSAVRSGQATQDVGNEDGEQIEARQYSINLQAQDSTDA